MALIETFCSGTRRLALFGTPREARRGWLTVGLEGADNEDNKPYTPPEGVELFDAAQWSQRFPNNKPNLIPLTQEIDNLRPKSPTRSQSQSNSRNNTPKTDTRTPPFMTRVPPVASPYTGSGLSPHTPSHSPYSAYTPYIPKNRGVNNANNSVNMPYNPHLNAQIQTQMQVQMQWQMQWQIQMQLQMQAQAAHMQMFGGGGSAGGGMGAGLGNVHSQHTPQTHFQHPQYTPSPSQSPQLPQLVYPLSPQPISLGFDNSRPHKQQMHQPRQQHQRPRHAHTCAPSQSTSSSSSSKNSTHGKHPNRHNSTGV